MITIIITILKGSKYWIDHRTKDYYLSGHSYTPNFIILLRTEINNIRHTLHFVTIEQQLSILTKISPDI